MTKVAYLKKQYHENLAQSFVDTIQLTNYNYLSNYYFYLGNIGNTNFTDWSVPVDSNSDDVRTRSEMLVLKKVSAADVSLVIRRINWSSGRVFDMYTSYDDLSTKDFYCLASNKNVYKCLYSPGTPTSVEPTHSTGIVTDVNDGYTWKFMYKISTYRWNKFTTTDWIPVQRSTSMDSDGSISQITVVSGGSGYTASGHNALTITGDGTGATAETNNSAGGVVQSVTILTPGSGYTYATATIATGTGASVSIDITSPKMVSDLQSTEEGYAIFGEIRVIKVNSGGSNYSSGTINVDGSGTTGTTVTIQGDGSGATAYAKITAGVVTSIVMTNPGSGYTYANVVFGNIGGGSGATATVIISPFGGHGFDAPKELLASTVSIYSNIRTNMFVPSVAQNFREYGLIKNPRDLFTNNLITTNTAQCVYTVTLSNITGLNVDDDITDSTGNHIFRIVELSSTVKLMPVTNSTLTQGQSLGGKTVDTILSAPTFNKYTGQLLFSVKTDSFNLDSLSSSLLHTILKL